MSARRDEIVAIAKKLFAEQGYVSTSMRDIADATGLLPGSLYTHFKSKARLVEEIVAVFYRDLLAAQQVAVSAPGTGAERLRLLLRATYEVCEAYPDELTILHYDWKELSTLDEIAEVREISVRTLVTWRKVIKDGISDGTLRPSMSPELFSRIATGAIHAMLDPVRYRDQPASKKADPVRQLEEVLLEGLLAAPRVGTGTAAPAKSGRAGRA